MYQVPGLKKQFSNSQGEDISLIQVQGCPNELTERNIFKHEGNFLGNVKITWPFDILTLSLISAVDQIII